MKPVRAPKVAAAGGVAMAVVAAVVAGDPAVVATGVRAAAVAIAAVEAVDTAPGNFFNNHT